MILYFGHFSLISWKDHHIRLLYSVKIIYIKNGKGSENTIQWRVVKPHLVTCHWLWSNSTNWL